MRKLSSLIILVALVACHHRGGGGGKPPNGGGGGGGGGNPPPARFSEAEWQTLKRFAAERVSFPPQAPYAYARSAAAVARGAKPTLNGAPSEPGWWDMSWVLAAYMDGDAATKEQARAKARAWLACEFERGRNCGSKGFRHSSMVHSLNHQLGRQAGIYNAVLILGWQEAMRYGDPSKIGENGTIARQRILYVLLGQAWFGTGGERLNSAPPVGEHPEMFRSPHYTPRNWQYVMGLADFGEPEVAQVAADQLDKAVANLRRCIGKNGLLDEAKCAPFRADTCTRCPCQRGCDDCPSPCQAKVKALGASCHPGEMAVLAYLMVPGVEWRPEFAGGGAECGSFDRYQHFGDYWRCGGKKWRPLK